MHILRNCSRLYSPSEPPPSGPWCSPYHRPSLITPFVAEYNVYSKPWRGDTASSSIYRPKAGGNDEYSAANAEAALSKLADTSRFRPHTDFEGVDRSSGAGGRPAGEPVQFEKAPLAAADPFGLDQFLSSSSSGGGRANALDKIGRTGGGAGYMAAAAGGASRNAEDLAGSTRDSIAFRSSGSGR